MYSLFCLPTLSIVSTKLFILKKASQTNAWLKNTLRAISEGITSDKNASCLLRLMVKVLNGYKM